LTQNFGGGGVRRAGHIYRRRRRHKKFGGGGATGAAQGSSISVMLRYPCVRACARLSVGGTGGHLYIGLSSAAVALSLAFYGIV